MGSPLIQQVKTNEPIQIKGNPFKSIRVVNFDQNCKVSAGRKRIIEFIFQSFWKSSDSVSVVFLGGLNDSGIIQKAFLARISYYRKTV